MLFVVLFFVGNATHLLKYNYNFNNAYEKAKDTAPFSQWRIKHNDNAIKEKGQDSIVQANPQEIFSNLWIKWAQTYLIIIVAWVRHIGNESIITIRLSHWE